MEERRLDEVARQAAQEAIAKLDHRGSWQNTILAILGVMGFGGSILFYIMDAQTDKKIAPIQKEIAVMKNDNLHIKNGIDTILKKLDSSR